MLPTLVPFADRIPTLLLHAAWQAGLLGLLVLALTWLLGSHLAPRWRFALWLIVFARLALPVLPPAPWSLFGLIGGPAAETRVAFAPREPGDRNGDFAARPPTSQPDIQFPVLQDELVRSPPESAPSHQPAATPISRSAWAAAVWAVGAVGLLLRLIVSHIRLCRRQQSWHAITTPEYQTILQRCRQELGIRCSVGLYSSPKHLGPATCGLIRPRIVLPKHLLITLSPQELRLLLLHELDHVRRRDVLIDLCATIIASLHWFHPVAWMARYFLRRERELACDAVVLERMGANSSADYGQVLLKILESLVTPVPMPGAVGMFDPGPYSLLKRRMRSIAGYRRATRLGLATGLALVAGLALMGLTDAQTKSPANNAQQPAASSPALTEKKEESDQAEPSVRRHPLTVKGRALDQQGRPIANATIFLVATNSGPDEVLGQALTDQTGRYEFNNVSLPYYLPKTEKQSEEGAFQVFGKAPAHGFAWLGMRFLYIDPDFRDGSGKLNVVEPAYGYLPTDSIEQELVFMPAMPISGRLVDGRGQPIAGVKVALTNCDYLDQEGKEKKTAFREFRYAVRQAAKLMPEQVQVVSDADGQFQLESVPTGIVCRLHMSHPDFGKWALTTATVVNPPAEFDGNPIVRSPIKLIRQKTRSVIVQVRYGDTGESVTDAPVGAYLRIGTNNSWGTTNGNGQVTLNLPPDEYTFWSHPPKGTDYLSVHSKFVVQDTDDEQTAELTMPPACVLILKAVDDNTGVGIEGVTFWYEEFKENPGKHWSVQSNDTTNDFPATNAGGILRALVSPGERRYGVPFNPLPGNYVAQIGDMRGRFLELKAGETVTAEFQLRQTSNVIELRNNRKMLSNDKAVKTAAAISPTARSEAPQATAPPAPYKIDYSKQVEPLGEPQSFTISGRALDENGKAIQGATIFLVDANNRSGQEKLAGEAVTDANGRYEFRDAKLEEPGVSELVPGDRSYKTVSFRLAGISPGRAFAWRGLKFIYLDHREAERAGLGRTVVARPDPHLRSFAPWEKIELDLTFPPPKPITGRLVDETGQPVSGVTIRLGACFRYDSANPKAYDHEFFCPNPITWKAPAPVADLIQVKTNDDGRFTLAGAPPGMLSRLQVMHPNFAWQTIHVCTADNPPTTTDDGWPVLSQPVNLTMRKQRTINITVQRQDSGEPLPDARVWVNEIPSADGTRSGTFAGCELDKNGSGKLKIPPGVFRLTASLPRGAFAHQQDQELVVADAPAEQSLIIKMHPDSTR